MARLCTRWSRYRNNWKRIKDGSNKNTVNKCSSTAHVKYKVYVQDTGWTDYVQDGAQAGTTGESKKIQAIQIEIEG